MSQEEEEIWKELPLRPDYLVSNLGRVRGPRGAITPTDNGRGYLRFSVNVAGQKIAVHVHQAVCEAFHGAAPEGKPYALHNDHIKHNCREDNLHWGSYQDNADERQEADRTYKRLSDTQVAQIRQACEQGASHASQARKFSITPQYVGKLVQHRTRKLEAGEIHVRA